MKIGQLLLLAIFILPGFSGFSQGAPEKKPIVINSYYHDKTPPLRDMDVILPGERKREWKDNVIQNKSMGDSLKNLKVDLPEGFLDPVLQRNYPSSREVRGPVKNFDGVGNVNGVFPPDTDGDVGPNHYFQMINLSFAIWDKEGNKLYGPVDNSTLWSGFIGPWTGTNDGDPIVLYDEEADRWVASQFAINTSNGSYWQLVAVSETPDPLGSYHRYAFQMPAFNDYPKLAVWGDAYYATFNMFGGQVRAAMAAFERDSMLVGSPARMVYEDMYGTFAILPSDYDGTLPPEGSPCYFADINSNQDLVIYEFNVDWSNTANSSVDVAVSLDVAPFNPNLDGVPQPNTSTQLDVLTSFLMFRLQYRNFGSYEVLMANHTVNAGGRAGIRWYELRKDTGNWYIYQQGTYSPDSEGRWMASIAMNGNGDIALGFNKSSITTYPSIYYTGRRANDPLGEMTIGEIMLMEGTSSQSGINRWGDYACMSVDPSDDSTFWFTTEYRGAGWKTRISSFDLGPLQPPFVDAGQDTIICESELFEASATATAAASYLWETTGDGVFLDPTQLNAMYLRGEGDVENGEVTLKVTAFGYGSGMEALDSLHLDIAEAPVANAGRDTTINAGESVMLNGYAENYDSIYWTTDGDGVFDNINVLNPVYTPGTEDVEKGGVGIKMFAVGSGACTGEDDDRMILYIDELTFIDEEPQGDSRLSVMPNPASEAFTFTLSRLNGEWTRIDLYNIRGQLVFTQELEGVVDSYSKRINVGYLENGTYILKAIIGTESVTEKIIVR